jgi:L-alanine-DL-glutamate epimerase-like enolase superfamily enzyme
VGRSPFDINTSRIFAFDDYAARRDQISPNQLKPKNGYIELPTAPGLGIDVNEEALKKDPGKNLSVPKLRTPADEGP